MRENCTYGSVRGVLGNQHPYRDRGTVNPARRSIPKLSSHFCGPQADDGRLATYGRLSIGPTRKVSRSARTLHAAFTLCERLRPVERATTHRFKKCHSLSRNPRAGS